MLDDIIADDLVDIVLDGAGSDSVRTVLEYLVRDGQLQRACYLKQMLVPAIRAMRTTPVDTDG